jgi:hypothetical protein
MVRGSNPGGDEIFHTCPDRSWGPPILLYNGYQVFSGGKERPRRDADPSPLLVSWSLKSRSIPLLPLWAVWPVQSLSTIIIIIIIIIDTITKPLVGTATRYGRRVPVGTRFSLLVQTGPEDHPAFCIGSFLGIKRPVRSAGHPPTSF